jgi:DNA-binding transcriptional regulator GbsR (MarR family)
MAERDQEAVARFIERFGSNLTDAGIPRLPARVFVALLASDSGRLTAAELAGQLQVSPAAVSGAVRYLTQVNLASREREPGTRRDVYRVFDDAWYEAALRREPLLRTWDLSLREGIEALGPETPAAARLAESLKFIEFLEAELPALLKRWAEHKATLRADRS